MLKIKMFRGVLVHLGRLPLASTAIGQCGGASSLVVHSRAYAIQVGDSGSISKTFTAEDVQSFADVTLDDNPIHVNAEYAKTTRFGKPIVHGILVLGLVGGVMGNRFPGPGSVLISYNVQHPAPVFVGENVTARTQLAELDGRKGIFDLECYIEEDGKQRVVLKGQSTILLPKHLLK